MEILVDILKDSKAHYLDVQSRVQKRLRQIPRGSVQKRHFPHCGGDYYYLAARQGRRVVSKYLGKEEPVQLLKEIEERKNLLQRLKDVRKNLAILRRLRWEPHAR